jgi:hypothetical protein
MRDLTIAATRIPSPRTKMMTANGLYFLRCMTWHASDVRDLIRGASKCGNVRRNSCAVQLKQKLLRHPSRSPVLFLPEIRTRSDVFRSNTQALSMSSRANASRRPRGARTAGWRAHSRLRVCAKSVFVLAVGSTPPQGFSYLVFAVIEASRTNKPAPRPLLSR